MNYVPPVEPTGGPEARIQAAQKVRPSSNLLNLSLTQVSSEQRAEYMQDAMFNRRNIEKKFEPLQDRLRKTGRPEQLHKAQEVPEEISAIDEVTQIAEDYYQRNPELQKKTLMMLRSRLKDDDTSEEMLRKVCETYQDQALADEAIDFLIEAAENRQEMRTKLIKSKEDFNAQFGREIRAGRNIGVQAREFSRLGLGSPTALRDLYREITGNPRDPHKLFDELTKKFEFSKMKNIIDFILHSLGADMKMKGASISRAELQRLFGEARTMQAILGLFRFFFSRMRLVKAQFKKFDLTLPVRLNFEMLAKVLMKLLEERYPSSDRVRKLAVLLGISEEVVAQIIILTQYRDALRHLSPKLFQSERHRQDLLAILIETLSDLEDEWEEEQEKREEE